MKICIVCTLYPPYILGGAEISTALLAQGLVRSGHEVTVITTGQTDNKEIIEGVTVYRLKNKNIYWRYPQRDKPLAKKMLWHFFDIYNVGYQKSLQSLLSMLKPDIIHTGNLCGLSCGVWDVAKKQHIPIVHTLRDYYLLCPQQTMIKGSQSCQSQCLVCKSYSVIKKIMSQKVDAVVGISHFILNHHLKFGYFKNATSACVIPNSIKPHNMPQHTLDTKDIGYIGRLSPEKGIELMIEAFINSNKGTNKLRIAGTGNKKYVNFLQKKYKNGNIVFCGKCNPTDFFQTIGLLIVPSLWNEPFGRVVIEAYSAHIPVLMASNGGLAELAEQGISEIFSTDSTIQLTNLLDKYFNGTLQFDYTRFQQVITQYSENNVTKSYIELYKKVINSYHYE